METIELRDETLSMITRWVVKSELTGERRSYKITYCKTPQAAAIRASKSMKGTLIVSGLTMHAETKPVLITN